ncbi:MAG: hypothetical protein D8M58_21450 [Calditrichaeota bacterium]|nr:MAG: hypothetical protein DWQ03_00175 [Calditrichota bacterium]MBL1207980.1 hypothetical protein [Calditrichota bacterium]NOG47817.1 hypothetical protein [Calditrichota bacterium]
MMPPETEDNVVDVSLKHIVLAFGGILFGTAIVGTTIVLVRDHIRFKRQKSFFDSFSNLINSITNLGGNKWKKE